MKKIAVLLALCLLFTLTGCDSQNTIKGLPLSFSMDDIEVIELIHHTGDPLNAHQKLISDSEDINYIYNMLSSDILVGSGSVDASEQTDTLYITFHCSDGTGYTIKFESYGVKKGIISSKDSPDFTYFTSADVCWIWGQLASEYVAQDIRIVDDPYATEKPVAEEHSTDESLALEELIRNYLAAKEEDFQSKEHLDLSEFFIPEVRDTLEMQLSWKVFHFEKLVRSTIVDTILWEIFKIGINDIDISETTATVSAYESYTYELSTADGLVSSRGTTLIFTCKKVNDSWFIESIDTDNELIEGHVENYTADELPALAGISE